MNWIVGASLAIAAGVAIVGAELIFMPFLIAHMTDYLSAKRGVAGMLWLTLFALFLVVIGIWAMFVRPRNSN